MKGLRTANFDKQLKATAKAIYAGDQANKQISKTQKFMNNYVTPFVNAIVTGQCFVQCISHICSASSRQLKARLTYVIRIGDILLLAYVNEYVNELKYATNM